jgi:hypothetical protein
MGSASSQHPRGLRSSLSHVIGRICWPLRESRGRRAGGKRSPRACDVETARNELREDPPTTTAPRGLPTPTTCVRVGCVCGGGGAARLLRVLFVDPSDQSIDRSIDIHTGSNLCPCHQSHIHPSTGRRLHPSNPSIHRHPSSRARSIITHHPPCRLLLPRARRRLPRLLLVTTARCCRR